MIWFQEHLYPDYAQVFAVDRVICHARTQFQDLLIFENGRFGRVLALDGVIQLTERDNHIYHELIAHVPLMAHPAPRDVLIIGGGDGGTLKEALRHPIETATLVELDSEMVRLSREHLPSVSEGAFDDARAQVIIADGAAFIAESGPGFDVIIIDSTDPIGPGEALFSDRFYADCRRRLRPGGVIVAQSGAPFFQPQTLQTVCRRLSACLGAARPYLAPVPTYVGGALALVAASESADALIRPPRLDERIGRLRGRPIYYTPAIHAAAFVLPPAFAALAEGDPSAG